MKTRIYHQQTHTKELLKEVLQDEVNDARWKLRLQERMTNAGKLLHFFLSFTRFLI